MYTIAFFENLRGPAADSARVIVPLVMAWVRPRSLIDVGCGDGTWVAAFAAAGVSDYLGIDGEYARPLLQIAADKFEARDLTAPLSVPRTFELAMCLEVAEHLPEASAAAFVGSLVALAPAVLFSAAIPHQRGTDHVNEQPPAYWAKLFSGHGYVACDCLRMRIWDDPAVAPWYAQNAILYGRPDWLAERQSLQPFIVERPAWIVHPRLLAARDADYEAASNPGVREAARKLKQAMKRRLG